MKRKKKKLDFRLYYFSILELCMPLFTLTRGKEGRASMFYGHILPFKKKYFNRHVESCQPKGGCFPRRL
jgi:hypothetical protein